MFAPFSDVAENRFKCIDTREIWLVFGYLRQYESLLIPEEVMRYCALYLFHEVKLVRHIHNDQNQSVVVEEGPKCRLFPDED